jgi:hypothetical protein
MKTLEWHQLANKGVVRELVLYTCLELFLAHDAVTIQVEGLKRLLCGGRVDVTSRLPFSELPEQRRKAEKASQIMTGGRNLAE